MSCENFCFKIVYISLLLYTWKKPSFEMYLYSFCHPLVSVKLYFLKVTALKMPPNPFWRKTFLVKIYTFFRNLFEPKRKKLQTHFAFWTYALDKKEDLSKVGDNSFELRELCLIYYVMEGKRAFGNPSKIVRFQEGESLGIYEKFEIRHNNLVLECLQSYNKGKEKGFISNIRIIHLNLSEKILMFLGQFESWEYLASKLNIFPCNCTNSTCKGTFNTVSSSFFHPLPVFWQIWFHQSKWVGGTLKYFAIAHEFGVLYDEASSKFQILTSL